MAYPQCPTLQDCKDFCIHHIDNVDVSNRYDAANMIYKCACSIPVVDGSGGGRVPNAGDCDKLCTKYTGGYTSSFCSINSFDPIAVSCQCSFRDPSGNPSDCN